MDGEGFEPSKALPTDLQSAPFGHSGIHPFCLSGTNRARTYDPLLVRQMLSQLSYDPIQTTQKRLELSTSAVTGRRSNQLSHWAIFCCTYVPSKLHTRNISFILPITLLGHALDRLEIGRASCRERV